MEVLGNRVEFVPIGLSLCRHVQSYGYGTEMELAGRVEQGSRVYVYAVVGDSGKRMLWYKRDTLVFVVHLDAGSIRLVIFVERCTRETITYGIRKLVVECAPTQCSLDTARMALACIGHHAPKPIMVCQDGQLLVSYLHIVGSEVERHLSAR